MVAPVTAPSGVREVKEVPPGYRQLQVLYAETDKAVRFRYHDWLMWLPKRSVVKVQDKWEFWASRWAVETARDSRFTVRADP